MRTVHLKRKRKTKLIRPKLQLKLVAGFLGVSVLSLLLQFLVFGMGLSEMAASMPDGGAHVTAHKPELLLKTLAFSFGILLPLTFATGILITFRIAGPLHRLEQHLRSIASGAEVGPCRLRRGDHLQELCQRVNEAVDYLRSERGSGERSEKKRPRRMRSAG